MPLRQLPNNQQILLAFLSILILGTITYTLELWPCLFDSCSPAPHYLSATSDAEVACAPAARHLSARALIDSLSPATTTSSSLPSALASASTQGYKYDYSDSTSHSDGFPRLIHQSWMDDNLPVKFSKWSDSLRLRHPNWRWVLWTDADNAYLISERHPHLNESYWALRNNIQRADFVRNLYMWDFGGVYADLDMECLRPLTSILTAPFESTLINPSFPLPTSLSFALSDQTSSPPTPIDNPPALAYAGSMETRTEEYAHSIPNAFLASNRRHHPFWLLPLSRVLTHLHAGPDGGGVQSDSQSAAEAVTGPEALLRSVERYRDQVATIGHGQGEWEGLAEIVHPTLQGLLGEAERDHEVVVFDPGVIYPFSWSVTEKTGRIHQACRAAPGYPFDPIRCQDACRAYERGARMITYWSHTWSQEGNVKDLGVVAVDS